LNNSITYSIDYVKSCKKLDITAQIYPIHVAINNSCSNISENIGFDYLGLSNI